MSTPLEPQVMATSWSEAQRDSDDDASTALPPSCGGSIADEWEDSPEIDVDQWEDSLWTTSAPSRESRGEETFQ